MKKCKIYHFYLKKIKEFNFIIHINIIHIIISSNFCKKLKERYICDKHFPIPISDVYLSLYIFDEKILTNYNF
ncbi:hypothetical protein PFAG_01257 [Plasmodium falciparum Santa Lucia]|uniref:Uncharacterized protein n=6 Tax=Plasmodium falciparum TaxID=5833 RepID=A0A024XC76_PLAFC|nr:hypothetical protein PFFVO_01289 [Plasmodium falciparum Vietnam Oak-Knoll (FVO)]ETW44138.1 hypothetical protein PFNF135_01391 [Plasmodium falciparum NF135/5.C10]ETW50586.1 hypothetical protein PFMALIP_01314 [Plasmodium falciparum MaliPS096_E11]ETW62788.1 hypothetical protein PFMC_01309 [Plasmodium falciparum CAMP/Malaysia]EUT90055.1 hypothetical protein PFAG_01257 [Plasmodium falciparum Santa Lucia]EWC77978.1 hypothetical protein C923_01376 [Plasmodium falciparum UGT5.1]